MGLDYSYLLYFNREQLWDVLQGVVEIAEPHHQPVSILFPDHELSIPLESWSMKERVIQHDDLEFCFSTVLKFKMDEAIFDYMLRHHYEAENDFRSPPENDEENPIAIGYIYMAVYQKIPDLPISDHVLFDFGTTGTRMSMLFNYSTSIREAFLGLLKKYQGVCGVFNKEEYGELFWLKGEEISEEIEDPYMTPEEIESLARRFI